MDPRQSANVSEDADLSSIEQEHLTLEAVQAEREEVRQRVHAAIAAYEEAIHTLNNTPAVYPKLEEIRRPALARMQENLHTLYELRVSLEPESKEAEFRNKMRGLGATEAQVYNREEWERFVRLKGILTDCEVEVEMEDGCGICREQYSEEDSKVRTRCGHFSGLECLARWMFDEKNWSCPFCRRDLLRPSLI